MRLEHRRRTHDYAAADLSHERDGIFLYGDGVRWGMPDRAGSISPAHLVGQRAAKVLGHFGGCGKVAAALRRETKFTQAVGVIAHARGIERQRHEGVKRQPTARLLNGLGVTTEGDVIGYYKENNKQEAA